MGYLPRFNRDGFKGRFHVVSGLDASRSIQLSIPAFMMSPEWSVNKAGALDGRGT
jgi:hypothetical protein